MSQKSQLPLLPTQPYLHGVTCAPHTSHSWDYAFHKQIRASSAYASDMLYGKHCSCEFKVLPRDGIHQIALNAMWMLLHAEVLHWIMKPLILRVKLEVDWKESPFVITYLHNQRAVKPLKGETFQELHSHLSSQILKPEQTQVEKCITSLKSFVQYIQSQLLTNTTQLKFRESQFRSMELDGAARLFPDHSGKRSLRRWTQNWPENNRSWQTAPQHPVIWAAQWNEMIRKMSAALWQCFYFIVIKVGKRVIEEPLCTCFLPSITSLTSM